MGKSSLNKSKTLAKSLFIIFVLIVFSHFSSQVPAFFDKNPILINLWDLIYLLVIGIVICYGLFTTKIDNTYTYTYTNTATNNNIDGIETYISGISHISSIFDDNPYEFDENTIKQNNPLGLPVRKLGLYSDARKSGFEDYISGVVPIKLEDIDSPMPFNWRSKSMRLANETSHLGLDCNGLKSRSLRSSMSSQMKNCLEIDEPNVLETKNDMNGETSFMESKPREVCNDSSSGQSDRSTCKDILKDIGMTKVDDVILDLNRNVQFTKSKSQRSGSSSSSHINNRSSFKDFGTTKVDDSTLGSGSNATFSKSKSLRSSAGASSEMNLEAFDYVLGKEEKAESLNPILKPAPITNTYKRGKSVRTNRLKEQALEENVKTFPSQTDDKVEKISKFETTGMNVKAEELSDTELHSGEVDRKADEFIAKFREQIRLQKVASATKLNHW